MILSFPYRIGNVTQRSAEAVRRNAGHYLATAGDAYACLDCRGGAHLAQDFADAIFPDEAKDQRPILAHDTTYAII